MAGKNTGRFDHPYKRKGEVDKTSQSGKTIEIISTENQKLSTTVVTENGTLHEDRKDFSTEEVDFSKELVERYSFISKPKKKDVIIFEEETGSKRDKTDMEKAAAICRKFLADSGAFRTKTFF